METDVKEKAPIKGDKGDKQIDLEDAVAAKGEVVAHDPQTGEIIEVDPYDYGADAGAGFDNQTGEDVSVPFMVVLQPGSPEVLVEGADARPGMWINKTTNEISSGKEGIVFIPCLTDHLMVEWISRKKGGGLVEQHAIDSDIAKRVRAEQSMGQYKHPDLYRAGMTKEQLDEINDLVETFYVYGLAKDATAWHPAVIAFTSTHIKPYKDWMFRIRSVVMPLPDGRKLTSRDLPMWAFSYALRTNMVKKGENTWYVPIASFAGENAITSRVPPGSELYAMCKSVYEGVKSGKNKAAVETLTREQGGDVEPERKATSTEKAPY